MRHLTHAADRGGWALNESGAPSSAAAALWREGAFALPVETRICNSTAQPKPLTSGSFAPKENLDICTRRRGRFEREVGVMQVRGAPGPAGHSGPRSPWEGWGSTCPLQLRRLAMGSPPWVASHSRSAWMWGSSAAMRLRASAPVAAPPVPYAAAACAATLSSAAYSDRRTDRRTWRFCRERAGGEGRQGA